MYFNTSGTFVLVSTSDHLWQSFTAVSFPPIDWPFRTHPMVVSRDSLMLEGSHFVCQVLIPFRQSLWVLVQYVYVCLWKQKDKKYLK